MTHEMKGLLLGYLPPGSCAWLIQKTGSFNTVLRQYTLEEARAARVL